MTRRTPQVIAHRGARNQCPENTTASISAALKLPGLRGVEFDVELAKSDAPMVLHQETVVPSEDFKSIVPATRDFTTRDWVSQYDAKEIASLDAGSWFNPKFSEARVPSLDEVLSLAWGDKTAYVELKDPTFWGKRDTTLPKKVVDAVISKLLNFSKTNKIDVISFNPEILKELHNRARDIPLTLALWTEWKGRQKEAVTLAKSCSFATISLPDLVLLDDPNWIEMAHSEGLLVAAYPVSPARGEPEFNNWSAESQVEKWRKLVALKVDALVSDFPKETLNHINGLTPTQ